ncbi:aminopeptidase P N-terminal domain-containing protein [Klebsiella pneumoniae subsp. pneumoniae]|nr:aminopeptidase P N-terminal domain-containing protein [Klebsiella pneumoniae subsp. pneumoniae]
MRSADSEYPYRQNSDFWYFTGFNEPEALLVLIKSDETHNHSVLFNRVRDLTAEIWFWTPSGPGGRAGEAWRRPGAGVQRNQPAAVSAAQRSGRDLLRPG